MIVDENEVVDEASETDTDVGDQIESPQNELKVRDLKLRTTLGKVKALNENKNFVETKLNKYGASLRQFSKEKFPLALMGVFAFGSANA